MWLTEGFSFLLKSDKTKNCCSNIIRKRKCITWTDFITDVGSN